MNDKQATDRRNALLKLSGLVIGAAAVAAAPTAHAFEKVNGFKTQINQVVEKNPAVILTQARASFGIHNQYDVSDEVQANKKRIGDNLTQKASDIDVTLENESFRKSLFSVVYQLMQTEAYNKQAQLDMKVLFMETRDAIEHSVRALAKGEITDSTARLNIRMSVGSFLDKLEQFPTA